MNVGRYEREPSKKLADRNAMTMGICKMTLNIITDRKNPRAPALRFSRLIARSWQERLGSRLLGAYLIGSLAHGGFNRRYSDIDMVLIIENGLEDGDLDAMRKIAIELSPKVSIFWADRHFVIGRFPFVAMYEMKPFPHAWRHPC